MFVLVNGKREDIGEKVSVLGLLEDKKVRPEVVTVGLNGQILDRQQFAVSFLQEGDEIEFVYYMGGGIS